MRPTWETKLPDEILEDMRQWVNVCRSNLFLSECDKMIMRLKRQCMTAVYLTIKES